MIEHHGSPALRRRGPERWLPVLLLVVCLPPALAQTSQSDAGLSTAADQASQASAQAGPAAPGAPVAPKRALTIVPTLTLQETFTDNVAPGAATKTSDRITQVTPGVRIDWETARVKAKLDYQVSEVFYAKGSQSSQTLQTLNSAGTAELLEKLFYVDVSGVIAQQSISAFGVQSPATYSVNANSTETSNFRISPYFKGTFAGYADYEARYSQSTMRSKSSDVSDVNVQEWQGRIGGDTSLPLIGWLANADRQITDYSLGSKSESDMWRGLLFYRFTPEWKFSVSAGRESNNYFSATQESRPTHGFGLDWVPNERTQVSAFRESRFFGEGHTVSANYRMPLSALNYTDTRDVSALPPQMGMASLGNVNLYQLYFNLYMSERESAIPDPVARAAAVTAFLAPFNIPTNATLVGGFMSSQVSLMRNQQLSYMLRGARNTLILALNRSQNDQLGTGLGSGDFALTSSIRQQGVNVILSHQLTGLSDLSLMASRSRSTGGSLPTTGFVLSTAASGANLETTQTMLSTSLSTRLSPKTTAVVTLRRTAAESTTTSYTYTENAAVGAVSFQF
jgi:uncharacterized protein (PEP-CTERM system associated)